MSEYIIYVVKKKFAISVDHKTGDTRIFQAGDTFEWDQASSVKYQGVTENIPNLGRAVRAGLIALAEASDFNKPARVPQPPVAPEPTSKTGFRAGIVREEESTVSYVQDSQKHRVPTAQVSSNSVKMDQPSDDVVTTQSEFKEDQKAIVSPRKFTPASMTGVIGDTGSWQKQAQSSPVVEALDTGTVIGKIKLSSQETKVDALTQIPTTAPRVGYEPAEQNQPATQAPKAPEAPQEQESLEWDFSAHWRKKLSAFEELSDIAKQREIYAAESPAMQKRFAEILPEVAT